MTESYIGLSALRKSMETKLCVIDKDGTLTQPISDSKFPQDPTDQILMSGVKEAVDRLRADEWHLAIASNQGGCDWHEVDALSLNVGQHFQIPEDEEGENPFLGDTFTVTNTIKEVICSEECIFLETGSQDFTFGEGDRVLVQYKTIEQAIEEVAFAADLCGITEAYFCPDMAGKVCVNIAKAVEP